MSHTVFLADETATQTLAANWAEIFARTCPIVYLAGDLGAGKTTFVRGLLRQLGHQGAVKSPTYAIVESYTLPAPFACDVHHMDLYRFTSPEEWADAGLDDVIARPAIVLIEWAQLGQPYTPAPDYTFAFQPEAQGRRCILTAHTETAQRELSTWLKN